MEFGVWLSKVESSFSSLIWERYLQTKKANNRNSKRKIGEIGMFFHGRHMVGPVMSLVKSIICIYSAVMKYRSISSEHMEYIVL